MELRHHFICTHERPSLTFKRVKKEAVCKCIYRITVITCMVFVLVLNDDQFIMQKFYFAFHISTRITSELFRSLSFVGDNLTTLLGTWDFLGGGDIFIV